MKKVLFFAFLLLPIVVLAQKAVIRVDTERIIGEIDPNIYGGFQEPTGRNNSPTTYTNSVFGPLYNPSSPETNQDGWNSILIEAMRELKIPNIRWPGGNYMSSYFWQDGIGPKEQRPARLDLARGMYDNNHVGTHEWVDLCRAIGAENVICFNLGLGDINDARYWVEYCNIPSGTYYSDLRIKNGAPEPFNVKYWCIGNEIDGWDWINGYKNAEDYCKIGLETIKAIKNVDRTIKTVVCGASFYYVPPHSRFLKTNSWYDYTHDVGGHRDWIDWNEKIIKEFTGYADYLSVHRYWAENIPLEYYEYLGDGQLDFEEKINIPRAQIEAMKAYHPGRTPLMISVDEWGSGGGRNIRGLMASAMCLNSFVRNSDIVKMANLTMMTSLLNRDRENGYFKSPFFYTFKLFSTNCLGYTIDTHLQCDTFDTQTNKGIPYLDVTSVYNKERGSVFVNVVNRHADKAITADIVNTPAPFAGRAQISSIEGEILEAFTYDKKDSYVPQTKQVDVKNGIVTYTFPAHSITQIEMKLR